jgi:hypothetical protein
VNKVRIVATNAAYAKLCKKSLQRLPTGDRSRVEVQAFASFADVSVPAKARVKTVFVSRLSDLPKGRARLAGQPQSKHVLFLEGLPIEAMASRLTQLDIRTPERLHLAAERSSERVADLVYRLLSGITQRNGPELIVDAWIEGEQLVLLSASFDRLAVPLEKLSKSIGTYKDEVESFEIDEDGRFLYWPHADAHFGWDQCRQLIDPTAALAAKQRSRAFNEEYGTAIRALRESAGLRQSDVKGVTERHLRRIEHGEQAASKAVLEALADAMGTSLEDCLKEIASQMAK